MKKRFVTGVLLGLAVVAQALAVSPTQTKLLGKSGVAKPVPKRLPHNVQPVYADLAPELLEVSSRVSTGKVPCELGAHVTLTANPESAGRFILALGRERHYMEPVLTSTGAVRLEDMTSGAVWLQLANKSMLMNQKLGKRMADVCMNAQQIVVAMDMERNPAPGLLEPVVAATAPQPADPTGKPQRLASATE